MAIIKSYAPFLNLSNFQVFENDEQPNSEYFRITELNETLTGGKNGFLIEGSEHLKESTEIKIEILDVDGNPIYFEPGDGVPEYYEGNSKLIAIHVYDDVSIGIGKITILGELKTYLSDLDEVLDIPNEWKGVYNVKWEKNIQINKNVSNETIVRFYKRPTVKIDELVKPIFTKNIPQITQTGSLSGISQNPPSGTDLSKWRAGVNYKLKIEDGISNWTSSVDDNTISVPSLNYSANVIEVLSNKEVMVDTPFTSSDASVGDFFPAPYTTTFEFVEGQTITDSALTGSFAKINFNNLKTFVGDVARVKVFRKSRNTIGDFQFVQESKLESSELLKDITTTTDTELSYGRFDENNLSNYWVTSSDDHPVTINSDILNASVKIDYDESEGGIQTLSTSGSFEISSGVEYTLNFRTLKSGSVGTPSIRAYFSGSNYEQNFLTIDNSDIYNTRQTVSQNILATDTATDTYLKFDIDGGDWYISNVSLKNAQDTSFSPDEFTLIQDIPRKLAIETFDFKFEFYDINNNYIPVDVTSTKAFTGGNDFPSSDKLLTFESDRNAFRFTSGSIGNPPFQQIQFKTRTNNLTGSVTYASSAFDVNGAYINPSSYSGTYPGTLSNVTSAGAIIKIADFSGSDDSITVGSIVYTASIEELEEFETVYRLEDGDNAPQLIVTSNVNQFIYEPTTLSPKPGGQSATIRAQRKNLFSLTTPIEVNSGSGAPPLVGPVTDNGTGIDTYTISALQYSSSFAGGSFPETTYSFTGSDQFDLPFSDEITISPVINFDAVSLVLSNESTSFPAKSTGDVPGGFGSSKGNVQMFIGGTQIEHDDIGGGRNKNTFDITSITETNVTAISTSPTTSEYGISAFPNQHDSGSLSLNIEYLAGDNSTSQSFQKIVSYTKSKKAVPNVEVSVNLQSQGINANSVGSGSESPKTIEVKATEGGENRFDSIGTVVYSGGLSGTVSSNTITFSDTADDMLSDTETLTIPVNFTDGEGTSDTKNIVASISRIREAKPITTIIANPQTQTVNSEYDFLTFSTPSDISVSVNQGSTDFTYTTGTVTANKFKITGVTSGSNNDDGTITPNTPTDGTAVTGVITVSLTNSEGSELTGKTINFIVGVSAEGSPSKKVGLSFSDNSIMYDADGTNPVPSSVTLTANSLNFRDAQFKFTGGGVHFTDETSFTDGDTANSKTTTFTPPSTFISTPLSFRVGVSEATDSTTELFADTESIIFVKPGEDVKPTFFIRPLRGTQIKNAGRTSKPTLGAYIPTATLELQVQGIDGTGSFDVSGSSQGDAQIYSGSTLLTTSLLGTSDGGNGVTYNPVLDSSAINGQATYHLRKNDGTLLDTIALVDVTDGLGGGSFVASKGKVSRRLVGSSSYDPSYLKATAVFFDTTGSEYRLSTRITPSFGDPLDEWTIATPTSGQSGTGHIVMTAADGDETNIAFDTAYASKDINVTAVFTDPGTGQKNTINETWYIISDGADGISAKTVSLQSSGQVFIKAKDGTITPSSITLTATKENISGSLNFSSTNGIALVGSGLTRTIAKEEISGSETSTVVTVSGSEDGVVFEDSVSIIRVDTGTDGLTILNTNQAHMFPADATGSILDFSNSGTQLSIYEGATLLEFNPLNPTSPYQGHWKLTTSIVTPANKLTIGGITDGGKYAVVADHTAMDIDTDVVNIAYPYIGRKLNGELFSGSFQQSITKGRAGKDAIQISNSNSSHTFPATAEGSVSDFTGGGTTIEVYEGADILTFTSGTPTDGEFSISVEDVGGLTEGAVTGNGTQKATIAAPSAMSVDSVVLTYTISGKRLGGDDFSRTTTQSFSKAKEGVVGTNAKTVTLTSASPIFRKSRAGVLSPTSIVITANGQNLTQAGSFTATDSVTLDSVTESVNGGTATLLASDFVDGMTVTYTAHSNDDSIADTVTFNQLDEGSGNVTAILSNEAHVLPADVDGSVTSYGGSGTTISVFEGATALDYDASGTTAGHWTVTVTQSPSSTLTIGTISDDTNFAVVAQHSAMSDSTDSVVITYAISGKTLNGTDFSFNKTQAISKAKEGIAGDNAKTVVLGGTSNIFTKAQNGDITPTSIVLTANGQNLTANGAFTTSAGTLTSTSVSTSGGSTTVTSANFVDGMVVTYTAAAADGSVSDTFTLKQLDVGSGNVQGILSNEAHVVPASNAGVVSSHGGSGTTISVYEGATQLDYDNAGTTAGHWTVAATTTGITVGGITDSSNNALVADHSAMSDSANSVTISYAISGKTLNGTEFGPFTKTQTITKSFSGAEGGGVQFIYLLNNTSTPPTTPTAAGTDSWTTTPGTPTASNKYVWVSQRTSVNGSFGSFSGATQFANFAVDGGTGPGGADGLRTVTGRVNFANVAATAPALPTATRLTFPDTFTSLTTNWSTATPTYASGNSNKYWYSNYTATEDSDRPGYASTVTFGTVTQAIGFSGLVTFSGAGLTDGTTSVTPTTATAAATAAQNLINAGGFATSDMANVTTIDGSKITTGTIESANWTTTAGGQINIAGGNMRFGGSSSPAFSVDSAGVLTATGVNVSGAITATSGTIGGWALTSTQLQGGTVSGGGDGTNTTSGMIINSGGFISAPDFNISSSGVASFGTTAKVGGAPFSSVFDPSGTDLRIRKEAKVLDGTRTAAFSSIFSIDNSGFKFNSSTRFGSSSFSGLQADIDTELSSISSNLTGYSCVLPGTKIISKRGEINVEDTKEDDVIKIFNFETKEWGWSSIDEIITNKVQGWSKIETELGKKLKCSNSHLLYHPDYPNSAIAIDELGVGGELYVYEDKKLIIDKIKSIETFDEEVQVWNYELDIVHNYISDGILSHNVNAKLAELVTLGHRYKKDKTVSISSGDLVKLDSNNELQKVSTAKDTSVVGILWEKLELEYNSSGLSIIGESTGSKNNNPPDYFTSGSFMDSFCNFIPTSETGSKEIWKVASVGDSRDYNQSGSYYTVTGFKMCNQGGDVVPGDLLCSSDTPGYLMKQPSEWVVTGFNGDTTPIYEERQTQCSYTVAKAMESSSWDSNGRMEDVYGYLYCG